MPVLLVLCIDIEVVENAAGYGVGVERKKNMSIHRVFFSLVLLVVLASRGISGMKMMLHARDEISLPCISQSISSPPISSPSTSREAEDITPQDHFLSSSPTCGGQPPARRVEAEAQDLYLEKRTIALDTGASERERAAAVDCLREYFSFSRAARAAQLAEVAAILKHELLVPRKRRNISCGGTSRNEEQESILHDPDNCKNLPPPGGESKPAEGDAPPAALAAAPGSGQSNSAGATDTAALEAQIPGYVWATDRAALEAQIPGYADMDPELQERLIKGAENPEHWRRRPPATPTWTPSLQENQEPAASSAGGAAASSSAAIGTSDDGEALFHPGPELPLAVLRLLAEIAFRQEKSLETILTGGTTEATAEVWHEWLAISKVAEDGGAVPDDEEWLKWSSGSGLGLHDDASLYARKVWESLRRPDRTALRTEYESLQRDFPEYEPLLRTESEYDEESTFFMLKRSINVDLLTTRSVD